jgi:thiol:disulfide interchange protein DsbA
LPSPVSDKQKFTDVYNSFAIQSKLNRTNQLLESYQVDSVPMVAVDGRFLTSPVESVRTMGRVSEETQNRSLLQVLDFLVSKAQKEKAGAPACG